VTAAILVGSEDRVLRQQLAAQGLRARVAPAAGVLTAFAQAEAEALLVVDARGTEVIPPWIPSFRRQFPASPVLMILTSLAPTLILEAMRAGVSECLADPVSDEDLRTALSRLATLRASSAPGQVFAFLGAKGGVGATTTAVNVATALSALPGKTLLIDLHLAHGDAAVFLGVEPRFSVVDALENMSRLDAAYFRGLVASGRSGPDLLASSDRAFVGSAAVQQVRQLVTFTARQYRYVVLDVPRSEVASLDAMDLATHVVVVANQELATVRNAARIAEALRGRYGKDRVSVIITRYDANAQIGQDDVERVTGTRVSGVIPSDYRLALQALNAGRPVIVENHTKLAASFRKLANRLADVHSEEPNTEGGGGLLDRLLGRRP
jgi:pilus assembly protein CpaE